MKISELFQGQTTANRDGLAGGQVSVQDQTQPAPGSVMVIDHKRGEATATKWIGELETEVLAIANQITQVTNADEQNRAVFAQASLARYIRAVQNAEEAAKKPLNQLRAKILDLSKQLISKADQAGNRLGAMVSDFAIAENNRVAALRRLQDEQASVLEREMDQRLAVAPSLEAQEAIKEEMRQQIADTAVPLAPVRVAGQVVREDWSVEVFDVMALFRAHPVAVKLTPVLTEIKALLDMGVKVHGVRAEKVTKSSVRLTKEQPAIQI